MMPGPLPLGPTLVIRPGALGDAILTLPALRALRSAGASSLTVLGTPASWGFVRAAHDGLRVRDFSSAQWTGLFSEGVALGESARLALAQTRSAVIYLGGGTSGVERVLKQAGVENIITIAPPVAGGTAGGDAHPTTPAVRKHASRQLLDPLAEWLGAGALSAAMEICDQGHDEFLRVDEHELCRALEKLGRDAPPAGGFFALHPGSGGRKKCWPAERFAKLAVDLSLAGRDARPTGEGLTALVFFGPADGEVWEEFESAMPPGIEWECADGFSLREALALLSCARGYVGNDSGMTHLAARACPTLALFGPTDPRVWAPLGERAAVLRAPGGELEALSVDEVWEAWEACLQPKRI